QGLRDRGRGARRADAARHRTARRGRRRDALGRERADGRARARGGGRGGDRDPRRGAGAQGLHDRRRGAGPARGCGHRAARRHGRNDMGTRLVTGRAVAALAALALGACSVVDYGGGVGRDRAAADAAAVRPAVAPSAWRELAQSIEGRPIRVREIGSGSRRVIWVGGIHGDETEGSVATDELPAAFAARPELAELVTLTIVEDANPDGRARGTRTNARGVDLNRNHPASNYAPGDGRGPAALSEPEARALHDLIVDTDPHLVIVAHSWGPQPSRPPCAINFDGPAEHLAAAFGRISGYPVVPSTAIHGTPGSLGSFVGLDRRIPILTLEYPKGRNPERCWEETRDAILAVIDGRPEALEGGAR